MNVIHIQKAQKSIWTCTAISQNSQPGRCKNRLGAVCLNAEKKKEIASDLYLPSKSDFTFTGGAATVLSDQRGGNPHPSRLQGNPSPRCLSVVRATGQRGTLERKIPMERRGPEEGGWGDDKDRRGRRRSVSWDLRDFTVVKYVYTQ